jgi:hypothetical protein
MKTGAREKGKEMAQLTKRLLVKGFSSGEREDIGEEVVCGGHRGTRRCLRKEHGGHCGEEAEMETREEATMSRGCTSSPANSTCRRGGRRGTRDAVIGEEVRRPGLGIGDLELD